ncbi:MAG: DUF4249 family protein [Gemmatimonadaceae bacterium]|jgi:hypothetical protein|nr:DUF4249 family protein [Gemmatimonadaceae bacterium]
MKRGLVLLTALLLTAGGCVFDRITLAPAADALIVHGVLNPGTTEQVVLLERSLSGRTPGVRLPFDSLDPIVSDGGTPVRNARVIVRRVSASGTTEDSAVLREDISWRSDGKGAGVYRFRNLDVPSSSQPVPHLAVRPGARYTLEVVSDTHRVTASTTIPSAPGTVAPIAPRQFFRDTDSLFLGWAPVSGAARYEIRVDSPVGPFTTFVDSLEYLAAGTLTRADRGSPLGRERIFWPGLRHTISVSAVDQHYFDYYRSGSDDLTARGLLSTVSGGFGVFGSMARVLERLVDVRTPQTGWPEGVWSRVGSSPASLPALFELWPEREAFGARRLTGITRGEADASGQRLVVAEQAGNTLSVTVLAGLTLRDTLAVMTGTLSATGEPRFDGSLPGGGSVTYRPLR